MNIVGTAAKRGGQLFAFEHTTRISYTDTSRPSTTTTTYRLGRVLSISREGEVTRYIAGSYSTKGRPARLWLLPMRFGDKLWNAWVAREPKTEFQTIEDLRTWVKDFTSGKVSA
jgi:hypothetical protein